MQQINEYLSILPSTETPLSAEVYIIKGNTHNYIFDVGITKQAKELIESIPNKIFIISHFHPDHLGNLKYFMCTDNNLYIGDYTYKILGYGTVVKNIIEINDGINLKIIPIPNSHAKGSLCVIINDLYLLIGDSLYCNTKGYNVSLLYSEIKLLKELKYSYVLSSHKDKTYDKDTVIKELEYYYSKKDKNKPYISFKAFDDLI